MKNGPLSWLNATATTHFASLVNNASDHMVFDISPPLPSGAPRQTYRIRVDEAGRSVKASEMGTANLPAFCPERHINFDGAFCLYWAEAEPLAISDVEAASIWWMKVLTFLRRQQSAAALRQWPGKSDARAHGPAAALQQSIAERSAKDLGLQFQSYLRDARLSSIRRRPSGEYRIRLLLDGHRVVTVKEHEQRVMTRRSRCKCERATKLKLPISACGDHETALANLTISLDRWVRAERTFYRDFAATGRKCCGTMDGCPLAA
jgi:hypothetical protein